MSLQEWCEYVRDVSDKFHLTSAYIAEKADCSVKTIERIEAVSCENDILRGTARRVEIVVFGPVGTHYCCQDHDPEKIADLLEQIEELKQDNKRFKKIIDKYID